MLKNEWKALFKNKFMLIVLIAIITIPTIYTNIFLGSMWDPYGEVEHLPVAVVNNDKTAEYDGKTVEVGKELVDKLQEEKALGFNFVSAEQAATGLQNGTYYMVITIPEDFSYNATTVLDENPKKMELSYNTNPGTNYIASKMSETAVNKIRTSVAEQVTNKYAEVIVEKFGTINDGLIEAADGTKELDEGADKLKDGSTTLAKNLNTLAESTLTFKDGANTLAVSLGTYTDGVATVDEGANKLKDGVDLLASKTDALSDGANQLADGSTALQAGTVKLKDGVAQVASGITTLKTGTAGALGALQGMSDLIGENLPKEKVAALNKLSNGLGEAEGPVKTANAILQQVETDDLADGVIKIATNTAYADAYVKGVGADIDKAVSKIEGSAAFKTLSKEEQDEILNAVKGIKTGTNYKEASTSAATANGAVTAIATGLGKAGVTGMTDPDTLKKSLSDAKSKIFDLADNNVMGNSKAAIQSLVGSLQGIKTGLDQVGTTPDTIGLIQIAKAVDDGAAKLNAGVNGTKDTAGLVSGVSDLNAGATKLNAGISGLTTKVPMLTDAMGTLQGGLTSLTDGTDKLVSNNGKLMQGANKLADGASKIEDASGKLADGANTLEEKLGTLKDGTGELNEKITDSSKELDDTVKVTGDYTADMISEPVISSGTEATSVANNGSAMAAYMMSVGLWVGCLAFSIMFSLDEPAGKITNGFSWWLSKASIAGIIAGAQAVVMVFALKGILGFNPVSLGKTILIAECASFAFMSIFYLFNLLMGKVGSFLLLIFMVLQLGGSAGTYPIELSNGFYQAIHPFMPFTHSVNAFRATIANGQSITGAVWIFIAIFVVCTAVTITVFNFKAKRAQAKEAAMEMEAVLE